VLVRRVVQTVPGRGVKRAGRLSWFHPRVVLTAETRDRTPASLSYVMPVGSPSSRVVARCYCQMTSR
jgi:hypothetical protein